MNAPSAIKPDATHRTQRKLLLLPIGLIVIVAFAAPLIAWDQPIVCKHEGHWAFPAMTVALQNIPMVKPYLRRSQPFRFPDFEAKSELDPDAFAVWPPIRFHPDEITDESLATPSTEHWLGTDDRGRDVAARLVHGATVSLRVGVFAMLLAGCIGAMIGALSGYCGGWVDGLLSRAIEATICFPALFLLLAIMVWVQPGANLVIWIIGLTQWPLIARLVRAEMLRLKHADYVLAARGYGASTARIVLRHLLPGALAPAMVTLVFGVADAILIEAGLSWLGFGIPEPAASWGRMLRGAYEQMRSAPHLVYPPCIAIFLTVLACHFAGMWLKRRTDPRSN